MTGEIRACPERRRSLGDVSSLTLRLGCARVGYHLRLRRSARIAAFVRTPGTIARLANGWRAAYARCISVLVHPLARLLRQRTHAQRTIQQMQKLEPSGRLGHTKDLAFDHALITQISYLQKPLTVETLLRTADTALERSA